jgi:hypothetical protein
MRAAVRAPLRGGSAWADWRAPAGPRSPRWTADLGAVARRVDDPSLPRQSENVAGRPQTRDGSDADANGYVDDIAGWNFLDDDNGPFGSQRGPVDRQRPSRNG